MQERRHYIRWQIGRQAKLKLEGAVAYLDCAVTNLNFNGMKLSLRRKLLVDKFLKMNIILSREFAFDVEAWIVWHKSIDGFNSYGFYFTKIKEQDKEKIYRFMLKYFPQQIKINSHGLQEIERGGGETMEKAKFEDRRVFERFAAKLVLKFLNLDNNQEGLAQTQDISAKGIGFVANEEILAHTPLEMWLQIPDKGEPLYLRGEVAWSKVVEPNKYRAGVDLEKADLMGLSRVLRTI